MLLGKKKKKYTNQDKLQLYEDLITPIHDEIYRFIFSIVRNKYIADDVFQETLYIGYKSLESLKNHDKVKSWIFTIAKRQAIDGIRKNRREVTIDDSEVLSFIDYNSNFNNAFMMTSEVLDTIAEIVDQLKSEYKDIILLVYYSGLSLQEVAQLLNMNYNTVKSKHLRAKKLIYQEFEKKDIGSQYIKGRDNYGER